MEEFKEETFKNLVENEVMEGKNIGIKAFTGCTAAKDHPRVI